MEPIRAVVFDAVGTLITPEPDVVSVYCRVGGVHGSRRSPARITRSFGRAFRETARSTLGEAEPHATSETRERDFWRSVVATVFNDVPESAAEACFEDLFAHFARAGAWRAYPDVGPALRELSRRRLTLAVASNFDRRLHGVIDGLPELAAIGPRFVSSELRWRKPDRRFFEGVYDGLGLRPEQILYVGDEPETDVEAARAAGLRAVWLRRDGHPMAGAIVTLTDLPNLIDPTSDMETT